MPPAALVFGIKTFFKSSLRFLAVGDLRSCKFS